VSLREFDAANIKQIGATKKKAREAIPRLFVRSVAAR
jgi:hypothetical protein